MSIKILRKVACKQIHKLEEQKIVQIYLMRLPQKHLQVNKSRFANYQQTELSLPQMAYDKNVSLLRQPQL